MVALPPTIAAYFEAVAAGDVRAVGRCFTDDAEIIDVDRPVKGRVAIARWAEEEVIGGRYTLHEITPGANGGEVLLSFVPPGDTGEGFRARYAVTLRGNRIQRMLLQYA